MNKLFYEIFSMFAWVVVFIFFYYISLLLEEMLRWFWLSPIFTKNFDNYSQMWISFKSYYHVNFRFYAVVFLFFWSILGLLWGLLTTNKNLYQSLGFLIFFLFMISVFHLTTHQLFFIGLFCGFFLKNFRHFV